MFEFYYFMMVLLFLFYPDVAKSHNEVDFCVYFTSSFKSNVSPERRMYGT